MKTVLPPPVPGLGAFREESVKLGPPELLAPAGDWECARAAVENGADAIYFGLEKFNARMRAHNFTVADLPALMEFLHRRGVRGYVTFNTLVFENELGEAEKQLRSIIAAGVDAAIVQDVGICRLIRRLSPDFPIHASTQMTITSAAGVEFAREIGCSLVVLARECSLKEIRTIRAESQTWEIASGEVVGSAVRIPERVAKGMPLEVFVHGALCVAYSGQCLTSEALGGRSANRGECAQACRMPYELISDGKSVPLGDRRYLLSPQDLAGLDVLPDLIRSGVASLKIEGRLKSPEYVANITGIYRRAIDECAATCGLQMPDPGAVANSKSENRNPKYEMEMAFSRGLHTGWFRGINNQQLVHARFGKKRGVYLGEVIRVHNNQAVVKLEGPVKPGDGVVFDAGHPEQPEEGGRVYGVAPITRSSTSSNSQRRTGGSLDDPGLGEQGETVTVSFGRGDVDFSRVHPGDRLWKTSDPNLDRRLRQSFEVERPRFRRPIHMEVRGRTGELLTLIARDGEGREVGVQSGMPLAEAGTRPLSYEQLVTQLGRLGGTPFRLGGLDNRVEGDVMLPLSELNRLRREIVNQLETLRVQPTRWALNPQPVLAPGVRSPSSMVGSSDDFDEPRLIVLVRSLAQLEVALQEAAETIYCEFADPKLYRAAVARCRAFQHPASNIQHRPSLPQLLVAPPRIFKSGEEWILKLVRSSDADGYLVRNYDHLKYFSDCRCVGDFSLNVANSLAVDDFMGRYHLERVTAPYDLNAAQLEALLQSTAPGQIEITIHQHMPMFHMEHCVFCAFLSKGTDYTNCGRPCDRHVVALKDRVNAQHPLTADAGCRNTVFNSLAQTGAEHVARMIGLGARWFRIEFLSETPEQVAKTIKMYRSLLRGDITGTQLWRELKLINQLGVTRGPIG